jgi:hypothetical protein
MVRFLTFLLLNQIQFFASQISSITDGMEKGHAASRLTIAETARTIGYA